MPKPRTAVVREIFGAVDGKQQLLDSAALLLYFPEPNTVTGEPVLELHTHGSPAIVRAVLTALGFLSLPSSPVRPAEPGEFTRRAFQNNRLSLPDVEALGDTLAAVTEEQRRLSVHATSGRLAASYESWRAMLLAARGELEALIDFAEDQHFDESPAELASNVARQVHDLAQTIAQHSANAARGELLRSGIALSLIGRPNVGKSSILNALVGRDAAIVSREAGTTRDVIEVGLDLGGFFCRLGDTAGLRSASGAAAVAAAADPAAALAHAIGEVEREGIRRARAQAFASDVVVVVLSIEPGPDSEGVALQLDAEVLETARALLAANKRVLVAINKLDAYTLPLASPALAALTTRLAHDVAAALPGTPAHDVFAISAHAVSPAQAESSATARAPETRAGGGAAFARFTAGLVRAFRELTTPARRAGHQGLRAGPAAGALADEGRAPDDADADEHGHGRFDDEAAGMGATSRQRVLLSQCEDELRRFLALVDDGRKAGGDVDIVLAAEYLRGAAEKLAKMTGRGDGAGDVEEVLGVVFEK